MLPRGLPGLLVLLVAVVLLLAGPGAALAQEGHDGHAEGPGFLQFDLGLWSIIVFVLLLLLLRRFAWGPMLQGLQRREHAIHSAVEDAERAREDARKLREQFEGEMSRAHDKVREMFDQARKDGDRAREQLVADARREIQSDRERLNREVEAARDQALQQIMTHTADLAALVSSKAIGRQMTPDDHRRLVDEALADLGRAAESRRPAASPS
jgi:F-type H+-transporting ATPase subunit b